MKMTRLNYNYFAAVLGFLCIALSAHMAQGEEVFEPGPKFVYDTIYEHVSTASPCVRLLDRDGTFGCTSSQKGGQGSLYLVRNAEEYNDFKSASGTISNWLDPKVVLLAPSFFNRTIVNRLKDMGVNGVLVLSAYDANGNRVADVSHSCGSAGNVGFSPGSSHPNKAWGLYPNSNKQWNPCGDGWAYTEIGIPIFQLNYNDTVYFTQKGLENKNNGYSNWPKWSAELNSFMWAAVDTETCLRRGHCDPLGGQSVWTNFADTVSDSKRIVLLMARMDSSAFFHELAPGANAHSAAVAALFSVADAIASWRSASVRYNDETAQYNRPAPFESELVIALFTGEVWGYLGSRKFLEDVLHFKCNEVKKGSNGKDFCYAPFMNSLAFQNISLDRIDAIIELDQIAQLADSDPTLYVHKADQSTSMSALLAQIQSVAAGSGLSVALAADDSANAELPPSSLHSFLRVRPDLKDKAVVLADYQTQYNNKYYHSQWDDWKNAGGDTYKSICTVANFTARLVWSLAMNNAQPPARLSVNCSKVQMFMDCLVKDVLCPYARDVLPLQGGNAAPTHYTDVYRRRLGAISLTARLANATFTYYTASQHSLAKIEQSFCNTTDDCPKDQHLACLQGLCINSTNAYYHDAVSLGFEWHVDELGLGLGYWFITNSSEPLFTEARWDTTGIRLYQSSKYLTDLLVLIVATVLTVALIPVLLRASRFVSNRLSVRGEVIPPPLS